MIEGINNLNTLSSFMPQRQEKSMTEEEKALVSEILAKFDTESITEEDKEKVREELKANGIKPSRELGTMLEEAGFAMRPPEGSGKMPPPPPQANTEETVLSDFVEKFRDGSASESDLNNLLQWIENQNRDYRGNILDIDS